MNHEAFEKEIPPSLTRPILFSEAPVDAGKTETFDMEDFKQALEQIATWAENLADELKAQNLLF